MALAVGYWLSAEYKLPRVDLYYLVAGVIVLWSIGTLAAWQPARRAAKVSPALARALPERDAGPKQLEHPSLQPIREYRHRTAWTLAIAASALVALVIGAISIRTSGVYFIMITLAFTQMLYYLGISIEEYGGDDGMRLAVKSQFPGLVDLNDANTFYYLVLAILITALVLGHRVVNSRFGLVLRAASRTRRARARSASRPTRIGSRRS